MTSPPYSLYTLDSFTTEDSAKLEDIKKAVLMPSKNREERKERVKKYLQWVRTITANNGRFPFKKKTRKFRW